MIITAGKFKGRKITAPDENITRPTLSKVRMSVFNTLQGMVNFQDASFLDMYAGSGIMGLEALSRGFDKVTAIEKNPKVANIIKSNFKKFDNPPKLIICDSLKANLTDKFDVIYIDPPYFSGVYEDSLKAIKDNVGEVVILEHVTDVNFEGFEIIKQKKYGNKFVTYLKKAVN